jgi:cytochrome c2
MLPSRRSPSEALQGLARFGSVVLLALLCVGCAERVATSTYRGPGNPAIGRQAVADIGCGVCHVIPGVRSARGQVGPTLAGFARRAYIAGTVPNQAENLQRWVLDPPSLVPPTAMPRMPITEEQAQHIVAFLYTLH